MGSVDYIFSEEDSVRVKSTLTDDTHAIKELLGQRGVVHSRHADRYGDRWYNVRFANGRMEPFKEHELDTRLARRKDKVTA